MLLLQTNTPDHKITDIATHACLFVDDISPLTGNKASE